MFIVNDSFSNALMHAKYAGKYISENFQLIGIDVWHSLADGNAFSVQSVPVQLI